MLSPSQLRDRCGLLGGSDIGALFGVGFKTKAELWDQKRRELETGTVAVSAPTWPMRRGTAVEPELLALFLERHGGCFLSDEQFRRDDTPWGIFHADGVWEDPLSGERVLVEAKNVSGRAAHRWDRGVPDGYVLQVQFGLHMTDLRRVIVIAAIGDNDPVELEIERSEEQIAEVLRAGAEFAESLLTGERPVEEGSVEPDPRHSDVHADTEPELAAAALAFREAQRVLGEAEKAKEAAVAALMAILPLEAKRILIDGKPVATITTRESSGTDFAAIEAAHPGLLDKFKKPSTWSTFPVASRRKQ